MYFKHYVLQGQNIMCLLSENAKELYGSLAEETRPRRCPEKVVRKQLVTSSLSRMSV